MLISDYIVNNFEMEIASFDFSSFAKIDFVSQARFTSLLERHVPFCRKRSDVLIFVGLGGGEPDSHPLAGRHIFDRESVMKGEVPGGLSGCKALKSEKENECTCRLTQHKVSPEF